MLAVIIVFTGIFLVLETPVLIKKKQWSELGLGSGILLLAIVYGLEVNYEWDFLPNLLLYKKLFPLADAFSVFFHLQ